MPFFISTKKGFQLPVYLIERFAPNVSIFMKLNYDIGDVRYRISKRKFLRHL